jgi:hypothetical protein
MIRVHVHLLPLTHQHRTRPITKQSDEEPLGRQLERRLEDVLRIELDNWEAHQALVSPTSFLIVGEVFV